MALFRRHRPSDAPAPAPDPLDHTVAGLDAWAAGAGWQPAGKAPFANHFEGELHEITRVMYGVPRNAVMDSASNIGLTQFGDAFKGSVDGRIVIVANGFTYIQALATRLNGMTCTVSVVAVEIGTVLPIVGIQPRAWANYMKLVRPIPTGDPVFDDKYNVFAAPIGDPLAALTPDVRRRIAARDDWCILADGYLLGCVGKGAFRSVEEVRAGVDAAMGIVGAIPTSVMPAQVDHSVDDLLARIAKIDTVEDALALLQSLTPDDRDRLARSPTPLADFADVHTPEEAMTRLEALPVEKRMQVLAMFQRVEDQNPT